MSRTLAFISLSGVIKTKLDRSKEVGGLQPIPTSTFSKINSTFEDFNLVESFKVIVVTSHLVTTLLQCLNTKHIAVSLC